MSDDRRAAASSFGDWDTRGRVRVFDALVAVVREVDGVCVRLPRMTPAVVADQILRVEGMLAAIREGEVSVGASPLSRRALAEVEVAKICLQQANSEQGEHDYRIMKMPRGAAPVKMVMERADVVRPIVAWLRHYADTHDGFQSGVNARWFSNKIEQHFVGGGRA